MILLALTLIAASPTSSETETEKPTSETAATEVEKISDIEIEIPEPHVWPSGLPDPIWTSKGSIYPEALSREIWYRVKYMVDYPETCLKTVKKYMEFEFRQCIADKKVMAADHLVDLADLQVEAVNDRGWDITHVVIVGVGTLAVGLAVGIAAGVSLTK